jgi:hypothetical protein
MATKIFPWTEIVPEPENEDDYLWNSIDTEITELPDCISLCEWGDFRILARVQTTIIGDINQG